MTGFSNGNGSGNGAGGPGDGHQQQQQQGDSPPWGQFVESINSMGDRLAASLRTELGGRLDNLRETVTHGFDREPTPPPPDPNEGFDFDTATNRQMYDHMMGQFEGMAQNIVQQVLQEVLEPFTQEISGLRGDFTRDKGTREITQLQGEHKDFNDWVPEMKQISQQHPSLSLRQVFNLARSENPDKAKELDTKYNPPAPPPPRPFSLAPSGASSGGNGQGQGGPARFKTKEEATRAAFEEVNARHGGVLGSLEDAFPTVRW